MTVTFVIGHGDKIPIISGKINNSRYIHDIIRVYKICNIINPNIDIIVPKSYYEVIHFYFSFLNDEMVNINDIKQLFTCFFVANYFIDNVYFQYLAEQVWKVWSLFESYIPLFPADIQKGIYLYIPYEFLPKQFLLNYNFFSIWLENNKNKEIIINGNDKYHTNVKYFNNGNLMKLETYHTIDGKKIGYGQTQSWYYEGQSQCLTQYYNGRLYGKYYQWYKNGQLERDCNYIDDKIQGVMKSWHPNGHSSQETRYINGQLQGLSKKWYQNEQLREEGSYVDNKRHGVWTEWYKDGKFKSHGEYYQNEKRGVWKQWDENGQLIYEDKQ